MNIDIESLERATVDAVAPQHVDTLPGWLLPMDRGTVGRAFSAVPLTHVPADASVVAVIEARYQAQGLPTVFRLADLPAFAGLQASLQAAGYRRHKPTLVQTGRAYALRSLSMLQPADVQDHAGEGWPRLFTSDGFDAADGLGRVQALSRAAGSAYASVTMGGRVVAAGVAAFSHGWCSIHGVRTEQAHRGQGLAGRVLAALAQAALDQGQERVFLQVEEGNSAAISLYRKAGFETAWRYEYWRRD
ncbi:MAG: GNAT family N-acetyltransferase [Polaromonas sp.]|nr:GNAT family N-acetyltransferase [Polaromonas sp.]